MEKKFSPNEIKQISPRILLKLIEKAKQQIKKDKVMIDIFKEYDIDINEIDYYPIFFKDLDVSAKTDHGIIYLNYKLLENGFDLKDCSYLIHEITHVLQQTCNSKPTKGSDDGSYLDNPHEEEAFQNQVEYISKQLGEDEAEDYVDNLLDHHEIDNKPEREDKKDELLSKV